MIPRKHFKEQRAYDRQGEMAPEAALVMAEYVAYGITIGIDCPIITETVTTKEEDALVNREHDQHNRCVAFDGSVKGWSGEQRDAMVSHLNATFKDLAYVTASGEKLISFIHDNGHGEHFHCAVNAKYKRPEYKEAK